MRSLKAAALEAVASSEITEPSSARLRVVHEAMIPYDYSVARDREMLMFEMNEQGNFSPVFHTLQIALGCLDRFLLGRRNSAESIERAKVCLHQLVLLLIDVLNQKGVEELMLSAQTAVDNAFALISHAADAGTGFEPVIYHVMKYSTACETTKIPLRFAIKLVHASESFFNAYHDFVESGQFDWAVWAKFVRDIDDFVENPSEIDPGATDKVERMMKSIYMNVIRDIDEFFAGVQ
jgi:hypothetical protein